MAGRPLVIVLAPSCNVAAAVRDVLRDWVALRLIDPLLWVNVAELAPAPVLSSVVATHLSVVGAPRLRLQDHLADVGNGGLLRLVALGSLGGETALVPSSIATQMNMQLAAVAPGRVVPLQCVLVRHGDGGWNQDLTIPGWQTTVLAPEDAWNPADEQVSSEFTVDGDWTSFVSHAAAGLASLSGLWCGMDAAAADTTRAPDDSVTVARAFLRRLDASGTCARLRRALTDLSDGLPLPRSGTGRLEPLQDPESAIHQVHRRLVEKHPDVFTVQYVPPEPATRVSLSAAEAVRMFLVFLLSSLRASPSALLQRVRGHAGTFAARRVQAALFGQDSDYQVVMAVHASAGTPTNLGALGREAGNVRERLISLSPVATARADLASFWGDVVGGAMSLCDGGDHGSSVGPVLVAGSPQVVRDVDLVVPSPDAVFALSTTASLRLGAPTVSALDVRCQEEAGQILAESRDTRSAGFDEWRHGLKASFAGRLGRRLYEDVLQRTADLRDYLSKLEADPPQLDDDIVVRGLRTVRSILLRAMLGLGVIVVIGLFIVTTTSLSTLAQAGLLAVMGLGWLLLQARAVAVQQARVFELLHAGKRSEQDFETAARNADVAAAGLQLSITLYQQYLALMPILGRFLRAPFGPQPPAPAEISLDGLLPRAVGFGIGETDDARVADAVHRVASVVFDKGWLQPLWEAVLAEAPRQLGSVGLPLADDPKLLFRQSPSDENSLLSRWSQHVQQHGVSASAAEELWRRALEALLEHGTAVLVDELLAGVRVEGSVQERTASSKGTIDSAANFFTSLISALNPQLPQHFSAELFTPEARSQEAHKVAHSVSLEQGSITGVRRVGAPSHRAEPVGLQDLDQLLVVVQTSAPLQAACIELRSMATRATPVQRPGPSGKSIAGSLV
jgi:hypothetical protein